MPSPFFSAAQETLLTGHLNSVALDCAYLPIAQGPTSLPVAVLLPLALCPRCSIWCLSTQRTEVGSSHARMAPTSSLSNMRLHYSQDALRLPHSFTSSADMCVVPEASYCAESITLTYIRKWQPTQYSCLENSIDRVTWQAEVHGVPKNQPQLSD